jgi:hypothetical protein
VKTLRVSTLCVVAAVAALSISSRALAQDDEKGPPLPFITIEGAGGGAITPMAYLVNPAKEGELFGKPTVATDYIGLGRKNMSTLMVTENLFGRVEFGFAADRLGLGTLPSDIYQSTKSLYNPLSINNTDVWLYNFSTRVLLVKENSYDTQWLPAITFGVDVKYNADIQDISNQLNNGAVLSSIGYTHNTSADFTLTATKTLPTAFFGKPLIVTGGLRESQGANLGFLGFTDEYHASFEGNVAILPFDKLLLAYEFRQKSSPFTGEVHVGDYTLIGSENNWHAFDAAYIISKHTTLVAGAGIFGNLANAKANNAWWLQLKYEF